MANQDGQIPEWLTQTYMEDVLQKSYRDPSLKVTHADISRGSQAGDNYACQIFRIKADFVQNGKTEKISLIGKHSKQTNLLENFGDDMDVFGMETFFFDKLLPKMNEEIKKYVPQCHYIDQEHSIFFMNDLMQENYQMHPRKTTLSKSQAKIVLEAVAVFHSSTYKVDKQDPALKSVLKLSPWKKDVAEVMKQMFRNGHKMAVQALSFYQLPAKHEKALKNSINRLEQEWCQICDFKEDRLNFILHGDCWKNNMLFRNQPESVKLLDFQIMNYNSFANDVIYFFFSSVDADVIINDLDELLEVYYNKLRSLAPEIPNLTLKRIKEEFAERYYFAFQLMLVFRPIHYGDVPLDMDSIMAGNDCELGYKTEQCKQDFRKLLAFFDERGVLDTV